MRVEQFVSKYRHKTKDIRSAQEVRKQAIHGEGISQTSPALAQELTVVHDESPAINEQFDLDLHGGRMSTRWRYKKTLLKITEYSNRISSVGYTAGNTLLMAKAGIHPDMDTLAGLLFNATSLGLSLADKYPVATYRVVGAVGVVGAAALSSKGINLDTGQIVDGWRFASPLLGFGMGYTLIGLQKEIAKAAEKAKVSKNKLKRAFASTQRYPVTLAAAIDVLGAAGVGKSAVQNGDMETLGIAGIWGIGAAALAISDPRVRMRIRRYLGRANEGLELEPPMEDRGTIFDNRQYNLGF